MRLLIKQRSDNGVSWCPHMSVSLMFLGKADLNALRNLRMGSAEFLAPVVDVVSAPIGQLKP